MSILLSRTGKTAVLSVMLSFFVMLVFAAMPATQAFAAPKSPQSTDVASLQTVALRGVATTATVTNTASLTISKPTGVVSGDLMIATLVQVNDTQKPDAPLGWNLIDQRTLRTQPHGFGAIYYKVAGDSEASDYTFIVPTGPDVTASGSIIAFSGEDANNPFDVVPPGIIRVSNQNTVVTALSITTVTPNTIIVMLGMAAATAPTWSGWSTPALGSLTEILDYQGNGTTTLGAAWALDATPGATGNGTANLSSAEQNGGILLAIKPKTDPTLSVTNSPVTYNGSPQAATVTGSVAGTVSNVQYNGSATVPTEPGTYAITADFTPTDTGSYNTLIGASAGDFVIDRATPTLGVTNSPVTYDGSPHAATIAGSVAGTASNIQYSGLATVPTNAGTYSVTADFTPTDTTHYKSLAGAAAGDLIIDKATPTLSVTNSPVTYDGAAHAATVTGSTAGSASNILTGGAASQTNAATYPVTADFTPTDTANYNSLTGASAGNLIINKASQVIIVTQHAPSSAKKGSTFTVAATGGSSGNIVTYSAAGACTDVGATFAMTASTGTCTVRYDQAGNDNYNAASQVSETVSASDNSVFLPFIRR